MADPHHPRGADDAIVRPSARRRGATRRGLLERAASVLGAVGLVGWAQDSTAQAATGLASSAEQNLFAHGAVGDGIADDGPALQSAITAATAQGGGTVLIPSATFKLKTGVAANSAGVVGSAGIRFRGLGPASRLLIATGANDAITLSSYWDIVFEDIYFVGGRGTLNDCRRVLSLNPSHAAKISDCGFYDLAIRTAGGAAVHCTSGDLRIRDCAFRGLGGDLVAGNSTVAVEANLWQSVLIEDTEFIDYGFLDGSSANGKTAQGMAAWVRITSPNQNSSVLSNALQQSRAEIRRCRFDEAVVYAIWITPDTKGPKIGHVVIESVMVNASLLAAGQGIRVEHCEDVTIRHTFVGYQTEGPPRDAVFTKGCNRVLLDGVKGHQVMTRLTTTGGTDVLTVRDCEYSALTSDAPQQYVGSGAPVLEADGDIAALPAGRGLLVTSRDGKTRKRIGINNAGGIDVTDPSIGAPLNPLSLYPAFWLKNETLEGLSDGARIASGADSSGNGRHAVQATTTKQPVKQTVDGIAVVRFDGVDDYLKSANFEFRQPMHFYLVVRMISRKSTNSYIIDGASLNTTVVYDAGTAVARYGIYAGQVLLGPASDVPILALIHAKFDGSSSAISKNNLSAAVGDAGPREAAGLTIGAGITGGGVSSNWANCDIAEILAYSTLSRPEEDRVTEYFNVKFSTLWA